MQHNFIHMIIIISAFLLANCIFMLVLFYYRKHGEGFFGKFSFRIENWLLHSSVIKLAFIFSVVYFIFFILLRHTGISCNMLDKTAQPHCYALEGRTAVVSETSKEEARQKEAAAGRAKLSLFLAHKKLMQSIPLSFIGMHGVKVVEAQAPCKQFADVAVSGEHFIDTGDIHLSKGTYYFILEALPTETEVFIYMIGEKVSFIFSWLNPTDVSNSWSKLGEAKNLEPIFSQKVETGSTSEKLMFVIESSMDQHIQLRIQHALAGRGDYDGMEKRVFSICHAEFGQVRSDSVE